MLTPSDAARVYHAAGTAYNVAAQRAKREAYAALVEQIQADWTELLGLVQIQRWDTDPVKNLEQLSASIKWGVLPIFAGSLSHPILSEEENFRFRAVHDYFAHYMPRIDFQSFDDEVHAFQAHAARFPATWRGRMARMAMAQEVIGQAGHFYTFGDFPAQLPGMFPLHLLQ